MEKTMESTIIGYVLGLYWAYTDGNYYIVYWVDLVRIYPGNYRASGILSGGRLPPSTV